MDPNIVFIVPVAMEFLASCFLLFLKWGSGKQHLLLVAEGWIYFVLALVDLFSVIFSPSNYTANRFRSFDIGIGIASFLPLVLYTLFLYLFTLKALLMNLPTFVIKVAKVSMFLALPLLIATNEVAAVTRVINVSNSARGIPSFTFVNNHAEWLWLFFTALTLAVLTAFQATVFSLTFFRVIWILVQKRRERHDIRVGGVGWVCTGVKLGALEAIIGFAGGRFEVSLTRRIVRFVGRACLCIGVVIGVDPVTEATQGSYDNLEKNDVVTRPRAHHKVISDPLFSTFQELSPMASGFHASLRGPGATLPLQTPPDTNAGIKTPHYLPFSQRQRGGFHHISRFPGLTENNPNQRVTVLYDAAGGPPLLRMRFSVLDVPLTSVTPPLDQRNLNEDNNNKKLQVPEPTRVPSRSPLSFDEDDILPLPNPPFAREGQRNRSNRVSAVSTAPSIAEIINLPRRTISQRSAEARLYHARAWDELPRDTGLFVGEILDSEGPVSQPHRPPTPWPSQHPTPNRVHRRTASLRSISDTIQAVQELASQFPTFPSPSSLDFVSTDTERNYTSSRQSDQFILAIGSPSELKTFRDLPLSPSVSTSQCETIQGLRSEDDIIGTSRLRYPASGPVSTSSSHTSYTIDTIKQPIGPVAQDTPPLLFTIRQGRYRSQEVSFCDPFVPRPAPASDAMRISEWVDDSSMDTEVHEQVPQTPDNGGETTSLRSRPSIVAGPRSMEKTPSPPRRLKKRVGSNMKPIVIPHPSTNLPKAIQDWDNGA